jgi:hypothetical protein
MAEPPVLAVSEKVTDALRPGILMVSMMVRFRCGIRKCTPLRLPDAVRAAPVGADARLPRSMPLPVAAIERELLHTRRLRYEGYQRNDRKR